MFAYVMKTGMKIIRYERINKSPNTHFIFKWLHRAHLPLTQMYEDNLLLWNETKKKNKKFLQNGPDFGGSTCTIDEPAPCVLRYSLVLILKNRSDRWSRRKMFDRSRLSNWTKKSSSSFLTRSFAKRSTIILFFPIVDNN